MYFKVMSLVGFFALLIDLVLVGTDTVASWGVGCFILIVGCLFCGLVLMCCVCLQFTLVEFVCGFNLVCVALVYLV